MTTKRTRKIASPTGRAPPEWPADKPIPEFVSAEEEDTFWGSYSFAEVMESGGEELVHEPLSRQVRGHVYRIRLDDAELTALQQLAHRRGVSASVIVRELVRAQWAKLRASGHLGSGQKGRR